jgi:response regulator RpfG family c-di-GMP phosphodiesterase
MNQIVIFEPDVKLNDLLVSIIDSCVRNFEVIPFYDYDDIISYLQDEHDDVRLLIINYLKLPSTGADIVIRLNRKDISIPTILLSSLTLRNMPDYDEFKEIHSDNCFVPLPIKQEVLSKKVLDILKKQTDFDETLLQDFKFIPVTPAILLYADISPEDIYMNTNDDNYRIVIKKGDPVNDKLIQMFLEKGVSKFHIASAVKNQFYDHFLNLLDGVKYEYDAKNEKTDLAIQQQILGMAFDKLQSGGIDEALLNSAKRTLENNLEMINNTKNLKKLLGKVIGKNERIIEHSMTVNFISQILLKQLTWASQTSQIKISMAAFFHDILITEFDDGVGKLESMSSYNISELKESNPKFFNHPIEAAKIIDGMKNMPPDVAQIIESHHELPKGKGFPKGLFGMRTAPLACLFNTVHYFSTQCYSRGWNKPSISQILKEMEDDFNDHNYKKPFKELIKLFK